MRWFGDVPVHLQIAGHRFWLAAEAIEHEEQGLGLGEEPLREVGERPSPDWSAAAVLLLASVQLDQLVQILQEEFGMDPGAISAARVIQHLNETFDARDSHPDWRDVTFEIAMVGEAVDMWRALRASDDNVVSHGFEVDGSITITTGPEFPELSVLGIVPSLGGELRVSPTQVLGLAGECTLHAAALAALHRHVKRCDPPGTSSLEDPSIANAVPESRRCPSSGQDHGRMIAIPEMDEWKIRCKTCGATWVGGSTVLDEHERYR